MRCEHKYIIKKQLIHVSFFVRAILKKNKAHLDQNFNGHTYFERREFKPVCQTKFSELAQKILKKHDNWSILKVKLSQSQRRGVVKLTVFLESMREVVHVFLQLLRPIKFTNTTVMSCYFRPLLMVFTHTFTPKTHPSPPSAFRQN